MKTNLKKLTALLVAVAMMFALAACGGSKTEAPAASEPAASTPAASEPAKADDTVYHLSWAHSSSNGPRKYWGRVRTAQLGEEGIQ